MANFVIVELGDNDFGFLLRDALRELMDDCGGVNFCPVVAKEYILEHVVSAYKRKLILEGSPGYSTPEYIREYLSKIRVLIDDHLPTYTPGGETVDHEHASAYYDVNLDKVFSF